MCSFRVSASVALILFSFLPLSNLEAQTPGFFLQAYPAAPNTLLPCGSIQLQWSAPQGHSAGDWIGLFRVGAPATEILTYLVSGSGRSGSWTLKDPLTETPGTCEFRFYAAASYTLLVTSNTLTVTGSGDCNGYTVFGSPAAVAPGGSLTVSWTAPAGHNPLDWVSLARVGDPPESSLWWGRTGSGTSGFLTLTAPATPPAYEWRIQRAGTYFILVTGPPLQVTTAPTGPIVVRGRVLVRTKPGTTLPPVHGAIVRVTKLNGLVVQATTDARGHYVLTLPAQYSPGQYTIRSILIFPDFDVVNYRYPNPAQTPVGGPSEPHPDDDLIPLTNGVNWMDVYVPQPVVLVHGIWPGGWETWEEGEALLRMDPRNKARAIAPTGWRWQWPGAMGHRGYIAFRIAYDTVYQYLNQSSATMRDWVNAIRTLALQNFMDPNVPIDIVAHSKGGLLTRAYLNRSDTLQNSVDRVFTMGTPHVGVVRLIGCSTPQGCWMRTASCGSLPPPRCCFFLYRSIPVPLCDGASFPGVLELDPLHVLDVFNRVAPLTPEATKGARFHFVGSSVDHTCCEPEVLNYAPFTIPPYSWDDEFVSVFSALFPVFPEANAPTFPRLQPAATITPEVHTNLYSNVAPHYTLTNIVLLGLETNR